MEPEPERWICAGPDDDAETETGAVELGSAELEPFKPVPVAVLSSRLVRLSWVSWG